ncbi:flagellar hook-associated protein FlgL [Cellvibrio fontiphilus]|jgi:flagellar hook-associated protein 3 FlgL|uniref:Flagellar hook-associated protein FlgL n=1 Tax=Cellvibrio fontiphilus TaxID=1815559 RepID=A0ABV7FCZ8_9GAMM
MRISTSQIYNIATLGISQAQTAVTKTQEQMATGKRILSPADDPVAATTILQLNQELARTEQYKKNIDIAENSLNLEETNIQTVVDLVHRIREIAVSAGNTAVFTAKDYQALAAEVDTRINELLNLQNTRNASGQYIFAGYQSGTKPFVGDGGGNFAYLGDEGQLRLQASASVSVAVSDSGKKLFVDIPSGHNTFITSASPANKSLPPAIITVGQVFDQAEFDKLYPDDLVVSFTKTASAVNYSVTQKSNGKQLLVNQPYVAGVDIEVAGARFQVLGNPYPGEAAIAADLGFGTGTFPVDFSLTNSNISITVGGKTETLVLDQNVTNTSDLVAAFNSITGAPNSNADKLANLGITVDATGFHSPTGLNIVVSNGTADTDAALGIATQGAGTSSVNLPFSFTAAQDFSVSPLTFQLEVNGKTENITFNQNITNTTDLANAFNDPINAAQLARLGLSVTDQGIISKSNAVVTIKGGSAFLDNVTGLNTQAAGTSSTRGRLVQPGDSFFVESTDKQGLLTTLSRFSDAMKNVQDTPESKAELAKLVAKTLTNLENSVTSLVATQGELGARLNTLETSRDLNLDVTLFSKTVLSSLQDLDYADASIQLSMQSFVLSASQQSFSKVSQLTLFNYL